MVCIMAVINSNLSFAHVETFQLNPGNRHLAATPHTINRYRIS